MLDGKMIFIVLPIARDAVGYYLEYTTLVNAENMIWKSYDKPGNYATKKGGDNVEGIPAEQYN